MESNKLNRKFKDKISKRGFRKLVRLQYGRSWYQRVGRKLESNVTPEPIVREPSLLLENGGDFLLENGSNLILG